MKKLALGLVASAAAALNVASAAVDVFITEVGGDVVATFSGSIDLTGATVVDTAAFFPGVNAQFPALNFGDEVTDLDGWGLTSFETFGPGTGGFNVADEQNGDLLVVSNLTGFGELFLDPTYVSGDLISGDFTFFGSTLAALGLAAGTYLYTLPNDQLNLFIGDFAPVPVPAAALLMAPALGAMVARRRRRT